MSKRAEEAVLKAYPELAAEWMKVKTLQPMKRALYKQGYEQAEKDMIERAAEWFRTALVCGCHPCNGNSLVEQFLKDMEEEQ